MEQVKAGAEREVAREFNTACAWLKRGQLDNAHEAAARARQASRALDPLSSRLPAALERLALALETSLDNRCGALSHLATSQ